ncbi:hypothetical protein ACFC1B_07190 [Streptomyces xiamenensis]|uniref:hypothetical protein n=1 Tax=Streptomyces xiamenensis TaxID=408015 RepID=UPI0035DFF2E2
MPNANTGCYLADRVAHIETPTITALAAVIGHLQQIIANAGTPDQEAARGPQPVSTDRHRDYVLGNATQIRELLDQITAPYEA